MAPSFELRSDATGPGRRAEAFGLRAAALDGAADALAVAQADRLERLGTQTRRGLEAMRGVIARTGLDPSRYGEPKGGIGGPLVPLRADAFDEALAHAEQDRAEESRLRRIAAALPLAQPIGGELAVSSGFGTRLDPFTRGLALHTGLDLKAEPGVPVRATAPGRVIAAEPAGGYGNMVEIDHGHGIVTRYAHLSRIAVRTGQRLRAGETLGLAGSSGRSTGSHLHYETRIDGEPTNPQSFLAAGEAYAALNAEAGR